MLEDIEAPQTLDEASYMLFIYIGSWAGGRDDVTHEPQVKCPSEHSMPASASFLLSSPFISQSKHTLESLMRTSFKMAKKSDRSMTCLAAGRLRIVRRPRSLSSTKMLGGLTSPCRMLLSCKCARPIRASKSTLRTLTHPGRWSPHTHLSTDPCLYHGICI